MTDTLKVLAQSAPSATTLTDIYIVPGGTSTVVSTLAVCNRSSAAVTYRVSIAIAGAANTNSQYIIYDATVQGGDSVLYTLGISLAATDVVRVYAGDGNLSFSLFGAEIT